MRIYCQKCGQPTEYSQPSGKPKFCSHCGELYGLAHYRLDAKNKSKNSISDPQPSEEDPDDVFIPPTISKLEVEIDTSFDEVKGTTIGELAGSKVEGFVEEPRLPDPDVSSEEFLESFKKEAGSLRHKGSSNG